MSKDFFTQQALLTEIVDATVPRKEITKTRDENGLERWDFTVISESYGKLVCSFYPQRTEETNYQYFAKLATSAGDADLFDATLAFDVKFPGVLRNQVRHAMSVLESVLPDVLEKAIVLSGQEAIHRTVFKLDGVTHRLPKNARASDGTDQLEKTTRKMIRNHVHHPRGKRRQKITAKQIRSAYEKWGPDAGQTDIASEFAMTDRQFRKKIHPDESYPDFRRRHTQNRNN
ncbi:hypothetical protein BH18ACI4_BH18ACI4_15610 [soil metagenome]